MKITNKITLSIGFFLLSLFVSSLVSTIQLSNINRAFHDVVYKDIELTEIVTTIVQNQLEKAVLFERVLRIAEESGFEGISLTRKEYLLDHLLIMKDGFLNLTKKSSQSMAKGKALLRVRIKETKDVKEKSNLENAYKDINEIIKAQTSYDALAQEIYELVLNKNYQTSFEDLEGVERHKKIFDFRLKVLLKDSKDFTKHSISIAEHQKKVTEKILWINIIVGFLFSFVIIISIVRSIRNPLLNLIQATHKISQGEFDVHLDETSQDEIGEVSQSFNHMAKKLDELNEMLEEKNKTLQGNLMVTENQKKDLEKINAELDRFVYTVSHDIKSPLMGISWYGDYLKKNYESVLDKKGLNCVAGVCNGADRLNNLISDLLDLTRIARIKNPYARQSTKELVQSVVDRIEFLVENNNVLLSIAESLPDMVCDRIKLGEVFYNLLSNAIKFSSKNKSVKPIVSLDCIDQGDRYEYIVKDNGIGIDPKFHDEVFQIFRRLHTNEEYKGTGAGLCIVKTIVEEHGGKIWIVSQPWEGSAFHFTIPKNLKPSMVKPT